MLRKIAIISLLGWLFVSTQVIGMDKTKGPSSNANFKGISLNVIDLRISPNRLDLRYAIQNYSDNEIWVCRDVDVNSPIDFETVASTDGSTLTIRLRLGVPMGWWRFDLPNAEYVRLMPGGQRRASIWLTAPVRQQPVFVGRSAHHAEELHQATRLVLEVGYLEGDLRERTGKLLDGAREALDQQQKDVERLMEKESELLNQQQKLEDELDTTVEDARKPHLTDRLERLRVELQKVEDALGSRGSLLIYLEDLDLEVSTGLVDAFEWIESNFKKKSGNELVVPYEYCEEIEREHFLRFIAEGIVIPHLPPRYLDLKNGVPWGRVEENSEK